MCDLNIQNRSNDAPVEDKFIVPFERNPYFTGRKDFLCRLNQTLLDESSKRFNHRVALYGMGGIGKTQTAIEYIYSNRSFYERIYWITTGDQNALLSGYQKIAEKANLKSLVDMSNPFDIAEGVIRWLSEKPSWLVVLDNLDDIIVAADLLPPTGSQQHTLITTRNPNSRDIPAEGLEVPLFGEVEALELLHTLSDIPLKSDKPDDASPEAHEIIKELDCLPLGIAQAAAFVQKISGDFRTFLDDYKENRKEVNAWISKANRSYPRSVAATSLMSLNVVRHDCPIAVELFQVLSFLNPDGILIEFLQAGAETFRDDLKNVLLSRIQLSSVLIELEKFSLLKWNRITKTLLIHRLVQSVVMDEMSDSDSTTFRTTVINLCDRLFPQEWTNENRELCRRYVGQVMRPLLDSKVIRTKKSANVLYRVGWFLRDDGKFNDSERLSLQAVKINTEILGNEHHGTLATMHNLASTYWAQGRNAEAATINEEVLEKRRRILGD